MKTALILPGGGAKGAIELGACKVILKKIVPDLIIGTSVGALNGAALADGDDIDANLKKMEVMWLKFKRRTFFPINYKLFYKFHSASSVFSNKGLFSYMEGYLKARKFEELNIPLYVNCTNMITGEPEFFSEGDLIMPLVASCSAAPVLPPVRIGGVPYVDGIYSSVFGVEKAISLGCNKVIIVNVDHFKKFVPKMKTIKDYADYMLAIVRTQNIRNELKILRNHDIEVVEISPVSPTIELMPTKLEDMKKIIELGEREAEKVMG